MTTIQSLPELVAPANQNFTSLHFATLPKKDGQAVMANKPQIATGDLVIAGVSNSESFVDPASVGTLGNALDTFSLDLDLDLDFSGIYSSADKPAADKPENAGNPMDNFSLDLDLDFDFSGIYSNGGMPATEADVESAAQIVCFAPEKLEESIVKIAKVEPKNWNTANIGAFVQAVLRESYMLQTEGLLDFANKVKHCNMQRKGLREHLAKLREVKTAIGPVTEEQAATTTLNGGSKAGSQASSAPTTSAPVPVLTAEENVDVQATINNIKSQKSSSGKTGLEERLLTVDGYREDVLAAVPHMSTQELWHLIHALGGSDFRVAEEISTIWEEIVEAMTPDQLVEMSATPATDETLEACNGSHKVTSVTTTSVITKKKTTTTKTTTRRLLNDCCELSRVAANRYQTIRDYASAELEQYGINASVNSPESLLIALEELKIHKEALAEEAAAEMAEEEASLETAPVESDTLYNSDPLNGFIDAVTINEFTPDLVATGERINTVAELDDEIGKLEDLLNSVGENAQMANLELQNALQKQQQTLQMISNISKVLHDTAMSIIRKIGS